MLPVVISTDVTRVLCEFYTCEVTTVNRQGQPVTWPATAYYDEATGQIILAASIAFPVKAFNARRHPQVSLLYSDPTESNLVQPSTVLVQGDATVVEMIDYTDPRVLGLFRTMVHRQPAGRRLATNRVLRRLFAWYVFQRLLIVVQPRRMLVWPHGDFNIAPIEIEVKNVE
jgi:hypothetical protein